MAPREEIRVSHHQGYTGVKPHPTLVILFHATCFLRVSSYHLGMPGLLITIPVSPCQSSLPLDCGQVPSGGSRARVYRTISDGLPRWLSSVQQRYLTGQVSKNLGSTRPQKRRMGYLCIQHKLVYCRIMTTILDGDCPTLTESSFDGVDIVYLIKIIDTSYQLWQIMQQFIAFFLCIISCTILLYIVFVLPCVPLCHEHSR